MIALELYNLTQAQVVEKLGSIFQTEYKRTGILASISMAQFLLESSYGKSELAINANNCFGMKKSLSGNTWMGSVWDGKSIYTKKTSEQSMNGMYSIITADFRKYATIELNIIDHSAYLTGAMNGKNLRFAGIVGCKDYKVAATIIKNGGYATSLDYDKKLCSVVEKWNLTKYDKIEGGQTEMATISKLATYYNQNPHKGYGKRKSVVGVAIHIMDAKWTGKQCADYFAKRKDGIGSNYCIGWQGDIACSNAEEYASYCTNSKEADMNCISIEVANITGAPNYTASQESVNSLCLLVADIFKRYNIKEVKWLNDSRHKLNFAVQNITVHRWFKAKACPGNYMMSIMPAIANNVNMLLKGSVSVPTPVTTVKPSTTTTTTTKPATSTTTKPTTTSTTTMKNGLPVGKTGYDRVFDYQFYYAKYPDLARNGLKLNKTALLNHFKTFGIKEGRASASWFDVKEYANKYADLQKAYGKPNKSNYQNYVDHFIAFGYDEIIAGRRKK